MLSDLLGENDIGLPVIYSEHLTGDGQKMFEHGAKLNFEGSLPKVCCGRAPSKGSSGIKSVGLPRRRRVVECDHPAFEPSPVGRLRFERTTVLTRHFVPDFGEPHVQDYVVVDVETTGSWASGDRITEIGAVKIRNHQVVDEWHSPNASAPNSRRNMIRLRVVCTENLSSSIVVVKPAKNGV
jgi:hypothetical protein